jgi:hypothetical protein
MQLNQKPTKKFEVVVLQPSLALIDREKRVRKWIKYFIYKNRKNISEKQ